MEYNGNNYPKDEIITQIKSFFDKIKTLIKNINYVINANNIFIINK